MEKEKLIRIFIISLLLTLILHILMNNICKGGLEQIRQDRINACSQAQEEYKDWIKERYIHNQDIIIRCATYMHLTFIKESGSGESRMCQIDNNCFGIKQPTYNIRIPYRVGYHRFLIFNNRQDGNLAYARLYMRFHMNKKIERYVNDWSMTDRGTYIELMRNNYWEVFNLYKLIK